MSYVGIDGFPGGWVAAWIADNGSHGFDYSCSLQRLLSLPHRRLMIDIPIGLPERGRRQCDLGAKELLKSSAVFLGARRSIFDFDSPDAANQYYWRHEGPGAGISRQLWHIREKMLEVDEIITPQRQRLICETHPQLVLWERNGRKPLARKKSDAGRQQRIEILRRLGLKKVDQWLSYRFGTRIGRDDLIDACACAIAARDSVNVIGGELDARGLRMEIHY